MNTTSISTPDRTQEQVTGQRVILCIKWGTKYGAEYVNRLYHMVRKHLQGEFRFVCLTDNTTGIHDAVQCFPIPELLLRPERAGVRDMAWRKLTTFSPVLTKEYGLRGTALFLDLDVVIVGSLNEFFSHRPGDFCIIKDYKRPWRVTGNSSVYRFELGAHHDVLSYFCEYEDAMRAQFRNEQAYLSDYLYKQGRLHYWPAPWCPSFKYHCIPRWPTNYWRECFIPEHAKVVIFHGECNPPDALIGQRNRRWRYIRPVRWIAQHWSES